MFRRFFSMKYVKLIIAFEVYKRNCSINCSCYNLIKTGNESLSRSGFSGIDFSAFVSFSTFLSIVDQQLHTISLSIRYESGCFRFWFKALPILSCHHHVLLLNQTKDYLRENALNLCNDCETTITKFHFFYWEWFWFESWRCCSTLYTSLKT